MNKINQWGDIGKEIVFCLLFLFGAFLIPDYFINRHTTSAIYGVALLSIILSLFSLTFLKVINFKVYNLLIVALTLFWILSQCFNGSLSIQDQVYYLSFCILFTILSNWFLCDIVIKFYFIAIIAALLMSLWGIAQYIHITTIFHNVFPVTGSFDNPAGIGIFLATLFPFCLFHIRSQFRDIKISAICISTILITTVLLSQSRTALLAIIIASILELSVIIKIPKYIRQYKFIFIVTAIVLCIVILTLMFHWKVDSAKGRLFIWKISWEMIKNNGLLGSGAGTFQAEYMLSQAKYFKLNPASEYIMLADNIMHPFNEYLST